MVGAGFRTPSGRDVTAVSAAEMRAVDRVAVEDVGLQLLQMMENAGRALARQVRALRDRDGPVVVVSGNGGNGGGGMAAGRHLANRGVSVRVVLDRPPAELTGAAATQAGILEAMGVEFVTGAGRIEEFEVAVLVDALIGYGLDGPLRSPADSYVEVLNERADPVVSLDVPSGIDATTGESYGEAVAPTRTVTLALPKTGLESVTGELYLADIGIPETVYERLEIEYDSPFGDEDWVALTTA